MNRYAMSVAVLAVTGSVCAQGVEWTQAEGGNGHWYERIAFDADAGDTFDSIRADAVSRGADLASIHSVDQDNFVANIAQGVYVQGVILGTLNVASSGCSFTWTDGSDWDYASTFGQPPWGGSQPNCQVDNTDGQPIGYYADGWHDLLVQDIAGAMFEWSADCNGDDIVDYGQILSGALDDADGNGVPDCCDAGTLCVVEITVDDDLMDFPDADFTSIQAAIDVAVDGYVIRVYPGTYTSTAGEVAHLNGKMLQLISDVPHAAIIDGESTRRGVTCTQGEPLGTLIEGFVIQNCATGGGGAGVLLSGAGTPTFENCRVIANIAGNQGGGALMESDAIWLNCYFENNTASEGGALNIRNVDGGSFSGCVFTFNESTTHGAAIRNLNAAPSFENCLFENNTAGYRGGGMHNDGLGYPSNPSFVDCEFIDNVSNGSDGNQGAVGGAIFSVNGSTLIAGTEFCGNTTPQIAGSWVDNDGNTFSDGPCFLDCNGNGVDDEEDIASGTSQDCNTNGVPDECDLTDGTSSDCNANSIPDECDLADGTSSDCNTNSIPDECDIADGTSSDCNVNSIPDECESLADCDGDGTSDACEILDGALDVNPADGVPDECQGLPAGACCVNGTCMMGTAANCFAAEGSYAGDGVSCIDANCPPVCLGDLVPDGVVDINDVLVILSEFGSVCP
jgi:hypothetical protein